jgi:hypothetical protein
MTTSVRQSAPTRNEVRDKHRMMASVRLTELPTCHVALRMKSRAVVTAAILFVYSDETSG